MSYNFPYKLDHVLSYRVTISEPEIIGPVAEGFRMNLNVTGGEFNGSLLKGSILPVGADWFTIRTDGVGILDVRTSFRTEDGALIYTHYKGIADLGPDGYQNILNQEPPPESGINLKCNPICQTAHPDYIWLNRAFLVAIGKAYLDRSEVHYDVYQIV
jgi:Protein of unknown function (DUF3237)